MQRNAFAPAMIPARISRLNDTFEFSGHDKEAKGFFIRFGAFTFQLRQFRAIADCRDWNDLIS
ncbi:hypothetical protein [Streptomyces sp. GbtcB6]|uniref:hypothetical protein n=1 Tax=Streptomyces sp. GbtcB6 TaxID=2824751 RepID=UPI001C30E414|nr:hypothetical protein [Streptomyces sp. GbtcB6]